MLLERLVHALEHPRQPPGAALDHHDVQLGEALEHARGGKVCEVALRAQPHLDVVDHRPARPPLRPRAGAGAYVERHREAMVLRGCPDRVVDVEVVRAVGRRMHRQHH